MRFLFLTLFLFNFYPLVAQNTLPTCGTSNPNGNCCQDNVNLILSSYGNGNTCEINDCSLTANVCGAFEVPIYIRRYSETLDFEIDMALEFANNSFGNSGMKFYEDRARDFLPIHPSRDFENDFKCDTVLNNPNCPVNDHIEISNYNIDDVINIYIVRDIDDCHLLTSGADGLGGFPCDEDLSRTVVLEWQFDIPSNNFILTHELGHIFGLLHTHQQFGNPNDTCNSNDLIFETGSQSSSSDCDDLSVRNNFMSYCDSNNKSFSQCQNKKMNDILKSCLGQSLCGNLSVSDFLLDETDKVFYTCQNEKITWETTKDCFSWYNIPASINSPKGDKINGIIDNKYCPDTSIPGTYYFFLQDDRKAYNESCGIIITLFVDGEDEVPIQPELILINGNIEPIECNETIEVDINNCIPAEVCVFQTERNDLLWIDISNGINVSIPVQNSCLDIFESFDYSFQESQRDIVVRGSNSCNDNIQFADCEFSIYFPNVNPCTSRATCAPCIKLGAEDILEFPHRVNYNICSLSDIPTFIANNDCVTWYAFDNFFDNLPDLTQPLANGNTFTPNNIFTLGTYKYALYDERNKHDLFCFTELTIDFSKNNCDDLGASASSIDYVPCYQAGETVSINWTAGNEPTLRLSLSIDGGVSWIFPSDIGLADDGFGLTIINDGNYEWTIPCISDVQGLEIVETTNAMLGLFEDTGFGFQTNGNGLIDASEPFSIKKCDDCLDIVVDSLYVNPLGSLDGGQNVYINSIIANVGIVDLPSSPDCQVEFYFSDDQIADDSEFIEDERIGQLTIGDDDIENTNFTIPNTIPDGQYYFIAKLECDTDLGSPCYESEYILPVFKGNAELDLQIINVSLAPSSTIAPGCPLNTTTTIRNTGTLDVDDTSLGIYLSTNNIYDASDTYLTLGQVPQFSANTTFDSPNTVMIPEGVPDGTYYLIFNADHDGDETEANEFNNVNSIPIQIQNTADLVVSNFSLSTTNITGNSTVDYSFDVSNIGTILSGATDYNICLSADNVADASDLVISSGSISMLSPSGVESVSGQANIPTLNTKGQQYIIVKIDNSEQVQEKSEDNNISALQVRVSPFDLLCEITPAECGGSNGTIALTPQGGTAPFMYNWETGATTNSIDNLSADFYSVTVTDVNGNTARKSPYVSDNGDPKWEFVDAFEIETECNTTLITTTSHNGNTYTYCNTDNTLKAYSSIGQLLFSKTYTGVESVSSIGVGVNDDIYLLGNHVAFQDGIFPTIPPLCVGCLGYQTTDFSELLRMDTNGDLLGSRVLGFRNFSSGMGNMMDKMTLGLEIVGVNSQGEVYLQSASGGNSSGNIYSDLSYNNVIPFGTEMTVNYSEAYIFKYDSNLEYQSSLTVKREPFSDSPTNTIDAFSIDRNDNIYILYSQITGFTFGNPFTSHFPFGPFNTSPISLTRLAKTNSNFGASWNIDISSPASPGIRNNIGFDNDGNPLLGNFMRSKFDKVNGDLLWSNTGTPYNLLSNEDDIGISTEINRIIIFQNADGAEIQSETNTGISFEFFNSSTSGLYLNYPVTTNPLGGFNIPMKCNNCSIAGKDFIGEKIIWGHYNINLNATSHSINFPDSLYACHEESIILDAENEDLDFLWSTGETSQTIEVSDEGKFFVTVTNDEGCNAIDSVEVFLLQELELNASISPEFCNSQDGSIQLMPQGGLAPYSYLWEDGSTDDMIIDLEAGDYKVTLTDDNECSLESTISVIANSGITDADFVIQHTSCGIQNGSISLVNVTGGVPPYLAQWSDGVSGLNRSSLPSGSYSVTITDNNGCQLDQDFVINPSQKLEVSQNPSSPLSCASTDGAVTFTPQNGQAPFAYIWSDGNISDSRSDLASGLHFVTITDNTGCRTIEQVDIPEYVESNIAYTSTNAICSNGSIVLDANQLTANTQIAWSTGATTSSLTNILPGFYEVTITDENNCLSSERIEITGNQSLEASLEATTILCRDLTPVEAMVEGGVDPYIYAWSNGDNTVATELEVGTHDVTITDQVGCSIVIEYEVQNQSNAGLISFEPDKTICDGESAAIQLFIEGVVGPFDITLNDGQDDIVISSYNLLDEINLRPNETTTYSIVEIADGLGCIATSNEEITITVNPRIQLVANLLDVQTCQGTSAKVEPIIIGGTAPYSITYNDGANIYIQYDFVNGDQVELLTANSTEYYFTNITDSNGCEFSFIDQVTIIETPCTISNDFLPADPCSCNDDQTANGAMDGTFSETISVSTTLAVQTWTITALSSLSISGTLPSGLSIGDQLTFDAVNNRHFADFIHSDLSGYAISVEGPNEVGNINNVTLDFQNICRYPVLQSDVIPDQINICELDDYILNLINSDVNNAAGDLEIYFQGTLTNSIDLTLLAEGVYSVDFQFTGDFISNANGSLSTPAFPGCMTETSESFVLTSNNVAIACNDLIELPLLDCDGLLTADMLIEGDEDGFYTLHFDDGQIATTLSAFTPFTNIDWSTLTSLTQPINYRIEDFCGQSCWGNLNIYHNYDLTPIVEDKFLECFDLISPAATNSYPEFNKNAVWQAAGDNSFIINFPDYECIVGITARYQDQITMICDEIVGVPISGQIVRTWVVLRDNILLAQYDQFLYLKRYTLSDIDFPDDRKGLIAIDWPSLFDNDGDLILSFFDANGQWNPSFTGSPTINGNPIDGCQNFQMSYSDENLGSVCRGVHRFKRTWTILDWCSSDEVLRHEQIIETKDDTAPEIKCSGDLTVRNDAYQCGKQVTLEYPEVIENNKPLIFFNMEVYFKTDATTEFELLGVFNTFTDTPVLDIPVGTTLIRYVVFDDCGNSSVCEYSITVKDKENPTAICDQNLVVTLGENGCAEVFAISFDNGSTDNCEIETYEIKYASESDTDYRASILTCCTGCQSDEMIDLRVTDIYGNTNVCRVSLRVDDKRNLSLTETPDQIITRSCLEPIENLEAYKSMFASAFNFDNPCDYQIDIALSSNLGDNLSPGECGDNVYQLLWTFTNPCGQMITHNQRLIYENPEDAYVATWPTNRDVVGCSSIPSPDELNDLPLVVDNGCNQTAISYSDQSFYDTGEACIKVLRNWTVINWCLYDPSAQNPTGIFNHLQILLINDDEIPEISNCPQDFILDAFTDNCEVTTDHPSLKLDTDDLCSGDDLDISWIISSSLGQTFTGNSDNANGIYPYDIYSIQWIITDRCGNINDQCFYHFEIRDAKNPTPYCLSEVTITFDEFGFGEIWTSDIDLGGIDNFTGICNAKSVQQYFIDDQGSEVSSLSFNCNDLNGSATVTLPRSLWYEDEFGNKDFCETAITIQDNIGSCNPSNTSAYTINILQENGMPLAPVTAIVTGNSNVDSIHTDTGNLIINKEEYDDDCNFELYREDSFINGVSTLDLVLIQKHILGITPFENEFQMVSADVNRDYRVSAIDLLELRKLILGVYDGLPDYDQSWRFVEESYMQMHDLEHMDHNFEMPFNFNSDIDTFYSTKLGDINGSVIINPLESANIENRSIPQNLIIEDQKCQAYGTIDIPVYADLRSRISGMQFELSLSKNTEIVDMKGDQFELNNSHWYFDKVSHVLRFTYVNNDVKNVTIDEPLFTLQIRSNSEQLVSDILSISNQRIHSEIYDEYQNTSSLQIDFRNSKNDEGFVVNQNVPNPFDHATSISVDIPQNGEVNLEVFNTEGKMLYFESRILEKGRFTYQLNSENIKNFKGVLIYKVSYNGETVTKRMISP